MKAKKIINILAYIAVMLVAGSLILGFLSINVFNWGMVVKNWWDRIAFILTGIVTIFCAFMYANSKRNRAYLITLLVVVIAIIVFMFL